MPMHMLLLEDVDDLGRSGDIVTVKPGFARNFLIPRRKALVADKNARRMQQRLKEEREEQAKIDREESEALAAKLEGVVLTTAVKVDHEGHMYGSVSAHDVVALLQQDQNIALERKMVALPHPIKTTGIHTLRLKLKEGVLAEIKLRVLPEGVERLPEEEEKAQEPQSEEPQE